MRRNQAKYINSKVPKDVPEPDRNQQCQPGDQVFIRNHELSNAQKGYNAALGPLRNGPYTILERVGGQVYKIDLGNRVAKIHTIQIFPAYTRPSRDTPSILVSTPRPSRDTPSILVDHTTRPTRDTPSILFSTPRPPRDTPSILVDHTTRTSRDTPSILVDHTYGPQRDKSHSSVHLDKDPPIEKRRRGGPRKRPQKGFKTDSSSKALTEDVSVVQKDNQEPKSENSSETDIEKNEQSSQFVTVYTDGACTGNGR